MVDPNVQANRTSHAQSWRVAAGAVTFVVVAMAFLALDDITTDNATRFPLEYSFLTGAAAWCLLVSVWMARTGHQVLAAVSLLALGGAVWGQRAVGPGIAPWQPEYLATLVALGWFLALSVILVVLGMRGKRARSRVASTAGMRSR